MPASNRICSAVLGLFVMFSDPAFGKGASITVEGDPAAETPAEMDLSASKELNIQLGADDVLTQLSYAALDGNAVFEGDIVLGTEEEISLLNLFAGTDFSQFEDDEEIVGEVGGARSLGLRGLAIKRQFGNQPRRWPQGEIPYVISADLPDPGRVATAIALWESQVPVRFVQRTSQKDYVVFAPDAKYCNSSVGMAGGRQIIRLTPTCRSGNVAHEIGHALGLGHEQTRSDRDRCVIIVLDNIIDSTEFNYEISPSKYVDIHPYDFDSIMHYGAFTNFNIDSSDPSILLAHGVNLPSGIIIGQRSHISAGDISSVKAMYGIVDGQNLPNYCP